MAWATSHGESGTRWGCPWVSGRRPDPKPLPRRSSLRGCFNAGLWATGSGNPRVLGRSRPAASAPLEKLRDADSGAPEGRRELGLRPHPRPAAALVRVRVLETRLKSLVFWSPLLIEGRGLRHPDPLEAATPSPPTPGPNSSQEDCGSVLGGFASTFLCRAGRKKYGRGLWGCRQEAGSSEFLSCSDGRMPPFDTDAQFLLPVI